MRRKLFAANWKMHKTRPEAKAFVTAFQALGPTGGESDMVVFAPATALSALEGSGLVYGGQNAHFEKKGAFTGEITMGMLVELGCKWVLIGHSERRAMFGETDEGCRKKLEAALEAGLRPMVCVGETLEERDAHGHLAKVSRQVRAVANGLSEAQASRMAIAYEPIWAIGTGRTASDDQAQEMCAHTRKVLRDEIGSVADKVPVLYGGSVKPENIAGLCARPDVDGALVGGASLEAKSFHAICANGGRA